MVRFDYLLHLAELRTLSNEQIRADLFRFQAQRGN